MFSVTEILFSYFRTKRYIAWRKLKDPKEGLRMTTSSRGKLPQKSLKDHQGIAPLVYDARTHKPSTRSCICRLVNRGCDVVAPQALGVNAPFNLLLLHIEVTVAVLLGRTTDLPMQLGIKLMRGKLTFIDIMTSLCCRRNIAHQKPSSLTVTNTGVTALGLTCRSILNISTHLL